MGLRLSVRRLARVQPAAVKVAAGNQKQPVQNERGRERGSENGARSSWRTPGAGCLALGEVAREGAQWLIGNAKVRGVLRLSLAVRRCRGGGEAGTYQQSLTEPVPLTAFSPVLEMDSVAHLGSEKPFGTALTTKLEASVLVAPAATVMV